MQYSLAELALLAKAYLAETHATANRLSVLLAGQANEKFVDRLLGGSDMKSLSCERASRWFDENWPPHAPWPREVPRHNKPARAEADRLVQATYEAADRLKRIEEMLPGLIQFGADIAKFRGVLARSGFDERLAEIGAVATELHETFGDLRPAVLRRLAESAAERRRQPDGDLRRVDAVRSEKAARADALND